MDRRNVARNGWANPFYERYKIEENAMVVESLKEDGSLDGEPGRFELKNGGFGKGEGDKRSAASEITDTPRFSSCRQWLVKETTSVS